MEGISSIDAAWEIMDEDVEQRMADIRRFLLRLVRVQPTSVLKAGKTSANQRRLQ